MRSPDTLIERYISAAKACDRDALLALYSLDLRMFDLMLPWQFRGTEEWAKQVDRWFSEVGSNADVQASDIEVRATDDMAVLTMNMMYAHVEENGERFSMTNRLTWVAETSGGDWKIVHEHTSVPLNEKDMSPVYEPS